MSLLDDAKRMAEYAPSVLERGVFWCGYCHEPEDAHAPDCPWLSMPRIVAALEAAEAVVAMRFAAWCAHAVTFSPRIASARSVIVSA